MKSIGKDLDETDKKIIQMIADGHCYTKISRSVYKTVPSIKYRVKAMKTHFNCETVPKLIALLIEKNVV